MEVESLASLTSDQLDRLPFGYIGLDADGVVVHYNVAEQQLSGLERERVLGRNFFRDIAPCTAVKEFEGRFRSLMQSPEGGSESLIFVLAFAGGDRCVDITITTDPRRAYGAVFVKVQD